MLIILKTHNTIKRFKGLSCNPLNPSIRMVGWVWWEGPWMRPPWCRERSPNSAIAAVLPVWTLLLSWPNNTRKTITAVTETHFHFFLRIQNSVVWNRAENFHLAGTQKRKIPSGSESKVKIDNTIIFTARKIFISPFWNQKNLIPDLKSKIDRYSVIFSRKWKSVSLTATRMTASRGCLPTMNIFPIDFWNQTKLS